jgi:hypothetical protein
MLSKPPMINIRSCRKYPSMIGLRDIKLLTTIFGRVIKEMKLTVMSFSRLVSEIPWSSWIWIPEGVRRLGIST